MPKHWDQRADLDVCEYTAKDLEQARKDGYRAGIEAMREAAARECEEMAAVPGKYGDGEIWCLHNAAKFIRALEVK